MQFNDVTNLSGICQDVDALLGTDITEYPITHKVRDANSALDDISTLILRADAKWEWDDDTYEDLPIATTPLVANQRDYSFSGAGFLKILKVECKDQNGNHLPLKQIDKGQAKNEVLDSSTETAGTPRQFDLRANSIFLYPKPSYASSKGLKVFYQRVMDYFDTDDTDKEPGFAQPFHRLVSFKMALSKAISLNMNSKIGLLREEIAKMEDALITHYAERNKDLSNKITLKKEEYGFGGGYISEDSV